MTTDFIGVSGVAKTTKAKEYFDQVKYHRKVKYPLYSLYSKSNWLKRNLLKLLYILIFTLRHYR